MDFGSLIAQYGYAALLAGVFIEGETVLLLAGYAAHRGYLQLDAVVAVAWLAPRSETSSISGSGDVTATV